MQGQWIHKGQQSWSPGQEPRGHKTRPDISYDAAPSQRRVPGGPGSSVPPATQSSPAGCPCAGPGGPPPRPPKPHGARLRHSDESTATVVREGASSLCPRHGPPAGTPPPEAPLAAGDLTPLPHPSRRAGPASRARAASGRSPEVPPGLFPGRGSCQGNARRSRRLCRPAADLPSGRSCAAALRSLLPAPLAPRSP